MKKILLLGDSIRKGYDKYIQMIFEGIADVRYPAENCRFTAYIIRNLGEWKKQLYQEGETVDLIHWNAGLWDDLRMQDGEPLISLAEYKRNVERIYRLFALLFPGTKTVFATSTPVREHLFTGPCKRYNADVERYNAAAVEIARSHGAVINDLYACVSGVPECYYSDMTHLYTPEGTRLLSETVCACIERVLDIRGKRYDEVALAEKVEVVGI